MSNSIEESTVTYEDLIALERSFEDAELEIIRTQNNLLTPLYVSRSQITSKIPNFWPLVLEQAPPDIDQYIQPSDSALLLSSLTSLSVSRFESEIDPRSISIKLEFKENEHFKNNVLEKKFWFRRDGKGFAGLVSEPVRIEWKGKDKDLTGGLLNLVCDAWEEEKSQVSAANGKGKATTGGSPKLTDKQKLLKKKISTTGMGGLSFFAWFGYIGRRVTAEESAAANELFKKKIEASKNGLNVESEQQEEQDEGEEEDDDLSYELEIFPDGDDLAIAINEDLWAEAIKYFTQAQEADVLSDADFEESDDDDEAEHGSGHHHHGPGCNHDHDHDDEECDFSDLNDVPGGSDTNDEEEEDGPPPAKKRKA